VSATPEESTMKKTIGIYIWQDMTMLDALAPQQILAFVPDFDVVTVAKTMAPVMTDSKLRILPEHDLESCPPLGILIVAGGIDPSTQMRDAAVMSWIVDTAGYAEYVTSVCTGSLILAEAGLLDGYRATTHWAYKPQLSTYPDIEVVDERVVRDGTRITAAGVTAGLDFGFKLVSELVGADAAAALQLMGEYDPSPGTGSGNPDTAGAELVTAVRAQFEALAPGLSEYLAAKARAAA
jgi:transcriptional regulator GlxA family with amidase domain